MIFDELRLKFYVELWALVSVEEMGVGFCIMPLGALIKTF